MGNHRMFSNTIIDSDQFLDMPLTSQALYFHLGMRADDDGFVGSPKKVIRAINCSQDDLKLLIAKGYVIVFESGVIVITHFNVHNMVRKDRKKDTFFQVEKRQLQLDENKVYSVNPNSDNQMTTICQSHVEHLTAENKLSENKLSEGKISSSTTVDRQLSLDYQAVVDSFNSICISLPSVQKLTDKRRKAIKVAASQLGELSFSDLFAMVESSDFLTGRSGKWSCCFDWILKPTNLTKIVEGNYNNLSCSNPSKTTYSEEW